MIRILLIENDLESQTVLRMVLPPDFALLKCLHGRRGVELVAAEDPDLVLLSSELPDADGFEILRRIRCMPSAPPVVILSAQTNVRLVVKAMKLGAEDYLVKPQGLGELNAVLRPLLSRRLGARDRLGTHPALERLIGYSAPITRVKRLIELFASTGKPVLLTGESGTGKELVARLIHGISPRREGPFVALNCGAIPSALVETELFGSEPGAFTDAVSRAGGFERASGGTLFLDEVAEMEPAAQVKLLRIMEESSLMRVGGTRPVPTDVRVVAATNADLKTSVREGRFRLDLYYRLNGLVIALPPLRGRKEDIPHLARHFLYAAQENDHAAEAAVQYSFTSGALEKLETHDWPGNVRELRNVVELAALFSDNGTVEPSHVSFHDLDG